MNAHPIRSKQGFTLLELVIAIGLATFIVAGLYRVFLMQSAQMAFLDAQAEMHQNLRFATDLLSRTLRLAGLGTSNNVTGLLGYAGVDDASLPALISYDSQAYGDGTDAVTVVHMDPTLMVSTLWSVTPDTGTGTLYMDVTNHTEYEERLQSYSANELLMCWDYARSSGMMSFLWQITGVDPTTGEVNVTPNDQLDYTAVAPPGTNLSPVMTCSKAEVVTFYIDNNSGDGIGPGSPEHPVLMMDLDFTFPTIGPDAGDVPLVDDIEDLQLAYCLEDADGLAPCNEPASWTDSIEASSNVWMVRLSLVARSGRPDSQDLMESFRPTLENHAAAAENDHYYRQTLVTEVTARNLRYYSNLAH